VSINADDPDTISQLWKWVTDRQSAPFSFDIYDRPWPLVNPYLTERQVYDRMGVHTEKGAMMARISQLNMQIATRERELQDLRAKLEKVSEFQWLDDLPDDSVVYVRVMFPGGNTAYTYILLRTNGNWFKTGKGGDGRSPSQMAEWLVGLEVLETWVVETWVRVEDVEV
jgi:hypothetical protein